MMLFLRILFAIASTIMQVFACMKLYQWHVRAYFPMLPSLGFAQIWGLRLALGMLTGVTTNNISTHVAVQDIPRNEPEHMKKIAPFLGDIVAILISASVLLVGYLLTP